MHARPRRERGSAVLLVLAVVLVGGLGMLLGILNQSHPQLEQSLATLRSLAEAREAVLAWAASNPTLPGQLPCPENTDLIGSASEGSAMASCSVPALGRLPWRTLGLPPLRDASGEPLWYAVSAGFRAAPINSASVAQLSVDGVANSAVAILFAPGPALPGQVRAAPTAGAPPLPANYLDGVNNAGTNVFVSAAGAAGINDQLALLTKKDLMRIVEARVSGELALRLRAYYQANFYFPYAAADVGGDCKNNLASGFMPLFPGNCTHPGFPATLSAPLDTLPLWFAQNGWEGYVTYAVASGCQQGTPGVPPPAPPGCGGAGRLTVGANTAVMASLTTSSNYPLAIIP